MKSLVIFVAESLESETQTKPKDVSENSNVENRETDKSVSENNQSSDASEEK